MFVLWTTRHRTLLRWHSVLHLGLHIDLISVYVCFFNSMYVCFFYFCVCVCVCVSKKKDIKFLFNMVKMEYISERWMVIKVLWWREDERGV